MNIVDSGVMWTSIFKRNNSWAVIGDVWIFQLYKWKAFLSKINLITALCIFLPIYNMLGTWPLVNHI